MGQILQDVRFALRSLSRSPGYAATVTGTIALGIAATTSIFTAVNAVVLRPLPFPASERVVRLCETNPRVEGFCVASAVNVADWGRETASLEHAGVARSEMFVLRENGRLGNVSGGIASPGYFRVLGITPAMGRLFEDADLDRASNQVAIVSHSFWTTRLASDRDAAGSEIVLDGRSVRIVGVLPADAYIPDPSGVDVWKPLTAGIDDVTVREWRGFTALGLIRAGRSMTEMLAELETTRAGLAAAYPAENGAWRIRAVRLRDDVAGPAGRTLWIFLAASALLWLLASVNAGSLMMMRTARRGREFAVRTALGAGRKQLGLQLLVEGLTVSIAGGLIGLALATFATRVLLRNAPPNLPRLGEIAVDGTVWAFAAGASIVAAVGFALASLGRASNDAGVELAGGVRLTSGSAARSRAYVVVIQTALAFVLVVGAGLLTRAFVRLTSWEPGFDRHGVMVAWLAAPSSIRRTADAAVASLERVRDEVAAVPGVVRAGLGSAGPLFGGTEPGTLTIADRPERTAQTTVHWFDVDPQYFDALGRRLTRGRGFAATEVRASVQVAVVNETLARQLFGDEDPIGRQITVASHTSEIVGVVTDVRPSRPDADVEPEVFWPIRQYPRLGAYLIVRAAPGVSVIPAVQSAITRADPDMQAGTLRSLDVLFDRELVTPRFSLMLIGGFAFCAMMLAAVGLYAVVAYGVSSRTRELGVRIALGATPARLVRALLLQSLRIAAWGIAAGLLASLLAGRFVAGMLYGVPAHDAVTIALAVAGFCVLAIAATILPARRAAALDPLEALRAD